jgi:hypothetical protein
VAKTTGARAESKNRAAGKDTTMLHLLFDWEYPHWMMMTGAILVMIGFIGFAFHRNRNEPIKKPLPERRV